MNTLQEKKIETIRDEAFKAIDNNPFIMKKMNLLWRLSGGKMSQADYMKHQIQLQYEINLLELRVHKEK